MKAGKTAFISRRTSKRRERRAAKFAKGARPTRGKFGRFFVIGGNGEFGRIA